MTHAVDAGFASVLLATVSAFLYIALGLWVLRLKPRRLQTTLLGLFALAFGLIFAPTDLFVIFHVTEPGSLLQEISRIPGVLVAFGAGLGLAWAVPEPLEDRRLLGMALGVGFGFVLLSTLIGLGIVGSYGALPGRAAGWLDVVTGGGGVVVEGLGVSTLVLLALRARPQQGTDPEEVRQLGLFSVAFATLLGFGAGGGIPFLAEFAVLNQPWGVFVIATDILAWLFVAGLWGWNMLRAGRETVRVHRTVMLAILGLLTAGAVFTTVTVPGGDAGVVAIGLMRTLGVGLLAYGILRHDLAGLDEKVEFGVSKTTVAGVFVAVFFVVSEGAQALFADFAGNEFLGVLAAGALVFAISPLQRLADRFAAKAVPGPSQRPEAAGGAEATYEAAVRAALRDGEISPEDRRHLAEVARNVGLDPVQATEIEEKVQAATGEEGT